MKTLLNFTGNLKYINLVKLKQFGEKLLQLFEKR